MRFFIRCALLFLGLGVALLTTEVFLRLSEERSQVTMAPYNPSQFVFRAPFAENSSTGWQLKAGTYQLSLGGRDRASKISINFDGSRTTQNEGSAAPSNFSKIVFVGDSFTFGEGLDDQETLPWRLQELLPDRRVVNHGVGGYGTCQAMLRVSQLKDSLSPGDIVVYGFSFFHEERNTADPRQDYWGGVSKFL